MRVMPLFLHQYMKDRLMVLKWLWLAMCRSFQWMWVMYPRLLVAQRDVSQCRMAVNFLETLPQKSLDPLRVTQAQREFTVAASDFVQLDTNLKSLPAISTSMPIYGARLSGALHVLLPAIKLSQAGVVG